MWQMILSQLILKGKKRLAYGYITQEVTFHKVGSLEKGRVTKTRLEPNDSAGRYNSAAPRSLDKVASPARDVNTSSPHRLKLEQVSEEIAKFV